MQTPAVHEMNRRKFLETSWMALLAGLTITLVGCEDSSTAPVPVAKTGSVSGSHPHTVVITQAQWDAGVGVTLTLSGSGHTHQITLSDADMTTLKSGTSISLDSTNGGNPTHFHTVTFT